GDCEIGKALRQIIEDELDACSARRLTRCRWNVGPLLAHDLLGKCRISLVEGVIPNSDAGAGTGRETCKRMARKTATHSAIASADAIAARRMSELQSQNAASPYLTSESCFCLSAAFTGRPEAGNCSTVACWPSLMRVSSTVSPSGNSSAS